MYQMNDTRRTNKLCKGLAMSILAEEVPFDLCLVPSDQTERKPANLQGFHKHGASRKRNSVFFECIEDRKISFHR